MTERCSTVLVCIFSKPEFENDEPLTDPALFRIWIGGAKRRRCNVWISDKTETKQRYLAKAKEAEQEAAKAKDAEQRAGWFKIAGSYRKLAGQT